MHKLAAALTVSTGGIIVWVVLALLGSMSGITYGNVAEQIRAAQTIQFHVNAIINGVEAPDSASTVSMKEPGHSRIESAGAVIISDEGTHKVLTLSTQMKSAQLVTLQGSAAVAGNGSPFESVEGFKKLAEAQGKPIADREIDGVTAKGFEMQLAEQHVSMWVHPKTGLPMRIESSASAGGLRVEIVMSGLAFDRPLEDSLFSLTAPAGYTVTASNLKWPGKDDLCETMVDLLRAYAARYEGHFPKSLDDWGDLTNPESKGPKGPKDGTPDGDVVQAMVNVGVLTAALTSQEKGTAYDYTPGNAVLGDAQKIVFWTCGKGGLGYRAVFGDLSIKDDSENQVMTK